jgi:thioredoxin 1
MTGLTGCTQTQKKEMHEPITEPITQDITAEKRTHNATELQNIIEKGESAADAFTKIINDHSMVIVDFYAEWCPPCKKFGPIFERVAAQEPNILFVKVNTATFKDLADEYGVKSIPYIIFFKDGKSIYRHNAPSTAKEFKSLIHSEFNL